MNLREAKEIAQKGIKVTHKYFTAEGYMTMHGETIIFEDGVTVEFNSWVSDKDWLKNGWSLFE